MEENLRTIFANVNEWLKFAEAKNAALVAANGAALFGALGLLTGDKPLASWLHLYLIELAVCLLAGLVIAFISFLPEIQIPQARARTPRPGENLLFYGDIALHSPDTYLNALRSLYGFQNDPAVPIESHYAEQIVVNSRIAVRKYRRFNNALWMTLAGLVTAPLVLCTRSKSVLLMSGSSEPSNSSPLYRIKPQ